MGVKIFLDDIREPENCLSYMYYRIESLNLIYLEKDWIIVRNYDDFVKKVKTHYKEITHISLDHDLGEDIARYQYENGLFSKRQARINKKKIKSGYNCAKFLEKWYREKKHQLPVIFVHSMNPAGAENIKSILKC